MKNLLDAYENEPIYARFSEATECADMIRCDAYWGHPAKRKPADLPSVSASSSRSILWFDPRREHSSVPTAKSSSRRAQGASRPAGSLPVRHPVAFPGRALTAPSTAASYIGRDRKAPAPQPRRGGQFPTSATPTKPSATSRTAHAVHLARGCAGPKSRRGPEGVSWRKLVGLDRTLPVFRSSY